MYNESLSYDKNGNILSLQRNGDLDADFNSTGVFVIDDLTYKYHDTKANQLMKVTDNSFVSLGFKDDTLTDVNDQNDDYKYDENGNMTADENKGIENIEYNHLNLPTRIFFTNGGIISYLYNAAGQKVQKNVNNTTYSIITDYLDGFQYVNQALNFFPHAEGYVNVEGTNVEEYKFFYVYNYTDHLGNIRVSYGFDPDTQTLKTLEENHYYPFGLKHTNYNTYKRKFTKDEPPVDTPPGTLGTDFKIRQIPGGETLAYKYKYNGKEYQDEMGLNVYDYGARLYDPAVGRWFTIDPLAEQGRRWTPYAYAMNNPVFFVDPDGMWPGLPSWGVIKAIYRQTVKNVKENINKQTAKIKHDLSTAGEKTGFKKAGEWFSATATTIGNGYDFKVKNPDNANDGIAKKGQGNRNTQEKIVDPIMDLTTVHGPEGSRRQTPVSPTNSGESSSSTSSASTMEKTNTPEEDEIIEIKIPETTFLEMTNSKSANKHEKDTLINKKDSLRVMNNAKEKQKNDTENFNKKHGTNF